MTIAYKNLKIMTLILYIKEDLLLFCFIFFLILFIIIVYMSDRFAIQSLLSSIEQLPLHHLFSSTSLEKDLSHANSTFCNQSILDTTNHTLHDLLARYTRSCLDLCVSLYYRFTLY